MAPKPQQGHWTIRKLKRAPAEAGALHFTFATGSHLARRLEPLSYIFFSEHVFVLASHMPPAFWQSASVFAAVTSPAKAGPVKASARVKANIEMRVFMTFLPYAETKAPVVNSLLETYVPGTPDPFVGESVPVVRKLQKAPASALIRLIGNPACPTARSGFLRKSPSEDATRSTRAHAPWCLPPAML